MRLADEPALERREGVDRVDTDACQGFIAKHFLNGAAPKEAAAKGALPFTSVYLLQLLALRGRWRSGIGTYDDLTDNAASMDSHRHTIAAERCDQACAIAAHQDMVFYQFLFVKRKIVDHFWFWKEEF